MIVLDTDILTFYLRDDARVIERLRQATEELAITVISRIEVLQGRFASLLKAADGVELQRGQQRLDEAESDLGKLPMILPIGSAAAVAFDRLRTHKKLKKIGRADLLIAAIVLATRATLVSRNLKDFRQVPGLPVENWMD